jgi:hypothetical protein
MGVIKKRYTVVPKFFTHFPFFESYVMISKGHVKSSLLTTGHVVFMGNLIQHFWHEMRLQHYEKSSHQSQVHGTPTGCLSLLSCG